jgi:putative ABC transport system ATP-binding protein
VAGPIEAGRLLADDGGTPRVVPEEDTVTTFAPPRTADPTSGPAGAAAVRAFAVRKVYGSGPAAVTALDDVTVGVARGSFVAVMGPSGSGKSTLMHCLAGLDTVTAGSIEISGIDLSTLNDRQLTKLRRDRIGFVFQAFNLVPTLTAEENMTLPATLAGRKVDPAWMDEVVATVGLRDRLSHTPSELSGGQQQRVAVARALLARPEVTFADEPTGNLDSRSGAEVLGFLRRAVDTMDQTVVMVTHDPTAAAYADRVLFLADGRLVDEITSPTAAGVLDRMKRFGE